MKHLVYKFDKVLESNIRMGIMSVLMVNQNADFSTLKELLELTDGNLASHLQNLEKNEYIQITKQFLGKKPNTSYKATDKGITAFKLHLDHLEKLIKNIK